MAMFSSLCVHLCPGCLGLSLGRSSGAHQSLSSLAEGRRCCRGSQWCEINQVGVGGVRGFTFSINRIRSLAGCHFGIQCFGMQVHQHLWHFCTSQAGTSVAPCNITPADFFGISTLLLHHIALRAEPEVD